jgi:hypothetical protein
MPSPLPRRRSNRNLRIFRKEPCWKSTVEAGPARLAVRAISRHPHSSTPCCDAARGARRRWRPREGAKTDVAAAAVARVGRARLQAFRALSETAKSARCGASQRGGSTRGARARAVARAAGGVETVGFHGGIGSASRPCGVRSAGGAFGDARSRRALESGTAARRRARGERATPSVRDAARGRGGHALTTAPRGPRAMAGACQGR